MCGRYSIALEENMLAERFDAKFADPMSPRYNAAPSQALPVIFNRTPDTIRNVRWGLQPPWIATVIKRDGVINVRMETFRDKGTFRRDLLERRCLVIADGFYEWKRTPSGRKTPFRVTLADGAPFAFAGIWESGEDAGERFAIITTTPNALIEPIHNRMPVMLPQDAEKAWLSGGSQADLVEMLRPFDAKRMRAYEVSLLVNRSSVDTPEVIKPVPFTASD
jgi:putative SOS response-associated peptidase YedK